MNDVIPFAYGDHPVRTLTIDGEPWFVLSVAEAARELEVHAEETRLDRLAEAQRDAYDEREAL